MKVKIIHSDLRNFPTYGTDNEKIAFVKENEGTLIGVLEVEDDRALDNAMFLSQNGMDEQYPNWIELGKQFEGNYFFEHQARSSSIGDVFVTLKGTYIVNNCGFLEYK